MVTKKNIKAPVKICLYKFLLLLLLQHYIAAMSPEIKPRGNRFFIGEGSEILQFLKGPPLPPSLMHFSKAGKSVTGLCYIVSGYMLTLKRKNVSHSPLDSPEEEEDPVLHHSYYEHGYDTRLNIELRNTPSTTHAARRERRLSLLHD